MRTHLENLWLRTRSLANDCDGEIPVGPLLVIGLVVIPLVLAMSAFSSELVDFLRERWSGFQDGSDEIAW